MVQGEVLPIQVQQEIKDKWTWRCAGCGRILFKMEGTIISLKCHCNVTNTLKLRRLSP